MQVPSKLLEYSHNLETRMRTCGGLQALVAVAELGGVLHEQPLQRLSVHPISRGGIHGRLRKKRASEELRMWGSHMANDQSKTFD